MMFASLSHLNLSTQIFGRSWALLLGLFVVAVSLPAFAAVPVGLVPSVVARGSYPLARTLPKRPVVAYFNATGEGERMNRLPWKYVTHVNVAFIGINDAGECAWMDTSGNGKVDDSGKVPQIVAELVTARNQYNPKTKLVLSVGGWTMSDRFSEVTKTEDGRIKLAQSCVDMVHTLGLDGLDYDWEYPTQLGYKNCKAGATGCQTGDDPQNFSALLNVSRTLLGDDIQAAPLSVAVAMTPGDKGIPYDIAGMDAALTYYNIMAYDNAAPNWSPGTAFHAPIGATERSLDAFVAAGASPRKLNLGLPMYAYVWENVPSPGLNIPAAGNESNATQYYTSDLLKRYQTDPDCKGYDDRDGTYYYCTAGTHKGEWSAIDTAKVLFEKATYVYANHFGGAMIWAIQGDSELGDRTRTIYSVLNPPPQK